MPRTAVTAIVLCILSQGVLAECVATATTKTPHPAAVSEPVRAGAVVAKAQPAPRTSGELIKTAAAGTPDDAPPAVQGTARNQDGQDHPRRGGTAMLLAALALMSGIALRRYGAPDA
jgi:hypothetical protein